MLELFGKNSTKKKNSVIESNLKMNDCIFCQKLPQKYSSIEVLNRALYHKYSSSQNYYYTKEIDSLVEGKSRKFWVSFIDKNDFLNIEEFLCDYYPEKEVIEQLKMFLEYYKYHSEIPRLEMNKIGDLVMDYHDSKRRFEYKKLKKMLNKPTKKPKVIFPDIIENPFLDEILTKRDKFLELKESVTLEELAELMGGIQNTVNFRNINFNVKRKSISSIKNTLALDVPNYKFIDKKFELNPTPKVKELEKQAQSEFKKKPLPKKVKTTTLSDYETKKLDICNLRSSSIIETLKTSGLSSSKKRKPHTQSSSNVLSTMMFHKKKVNSEHGIFYKKIENLLKTKDLNERRSLCQKSLNKMQNSKKLSIDSEKIKNTHHIKTASLPSKSLETMNSPKGQLHVGINNKKLKTLSLLTNTNVNSFSKMKAIKNRNKSELSENQSMEKLSFKISLIKNLLAKDPNFKPEKLLDKTGSPNNSDSQKNKRKEISTKSSSNRDSKLRDDYKNSFASKILSFLTEGKNSNNNSKKNLSWNKIKDDTNHLIKDLLAKYRK